MKTFKFNVAKSATCVTELVVSEENLTKEQKDLLLGNFLNEWDNLPEEVQVWFLLMLSDAAKKKFTNGRFKSVIESMGSKFIKIN